MNDGDKALVVAEPTLVEVADRECKDVVPLYYPMAKAEPEEITPSALFNGMVDAWTGGNIGVISNHITKIWQMDEPDEEAIKVLCMENNFTIDFAKTRYKTTRPEEWDKRLRKTDSGKLPAFFEYAKGKEPGQITKRGDGVVDRIYYSICDYKFKFDKSVVGRFEPEMLMYEPLKEYGEKEKKVVDYFRKQTQELYGYDSTLAYSEDDRYCYFIKKLRKDMQQFGSTQKIVDILIHGLFIDRKVRRKSAFWDCFGDTVEMNLNNNLREHRGRCVCCGKRFRATMGVNEIICPACRPEKADPIRTARCAVCGETFMTRETLPVSTCPVCRMVKDAKSKCVDCGTPIYNSRGKGRRSCRCADCQTARNKEKVREWKIKYRQKK